MTRKKRPFEAPSLGEIDEELERSAKDTLNVSAYDVLSEARKTENDMGLSQALNALADFSPIQTLGWDERRRKAAAADADKVHEAYAKRYKELCPASAEGLTIMTERDLDTPEWQKACRRFQRLKQREREDIAEVYRRQGSRLAEEAPSEAEQCPPEATPKAMAARSKPKAPADPKDGLSRGCGPPWVRLFLATTLIAVLQVVAMYLANRYGEGANFFLRAVSLWQLPVLAFAVGAGLFCWLVGKEGIRALPWPFNSRWQ